MGTVQEVGGVLDSILSKTETTLKVAQLCKTGSYWPASKVNNKNSRDRLTKSALKPITSITKAVSKRAAIATMGAPVAVTPSPKNRCNQKPFQVVLWKPPWNLKQTNTSGGHVCH